MSDRRDAALKSAAIMVTMQAAFASAVEAFTYDPKIADAKFVEYDDGEVDLESIETHFESENNFKELTVEKGSSVEGEIIKFLEKNTDFKFNGEGLVEGEDVTKWAEKTAHNMELELTGQSNTEIIDMVRPGTEIQLNLSDTNNIHLAYVETPTWEGVGEKL